MGKHILKSRVLLALIASISISFLVIISALSISVWAQIEVGTTSTTQSLITNSASDPQLESWHSYKDVDAFGISNEIVVTPVQTPTFEEVSSTIELSMQSDSQIEPPQTQSPLSVPSTPQERALNCEFRSATDLAAYYGWSFTWQELFKVVGHAPSGNPNEGFIGTSLDDDVGGLFPDGYGVYAEPLARGLRRLGISASAYQHEDTTWLKKQVASGDPVMIWATYNMIEQPVISWQTTDGETVKGVPFEHTFTVIGYDVSGIWVNDPYDAERKFFTWSVFEKAWALFDQMALIIDEEIPE